MGARGESFVNEEILGKFRIEGEGYFLQWNSQTLKYTGYTPKYSQQTLSHREKFLKAKFPFEVFCLLAIVADGVAWGIEMTLFCCFGEKVNNLRVLFV